MAVTRERLSATSAQNVTNFFLKPEDEENKHVKKLKKKMGQTWVRMDEMFGLEWVERILESGESVLTFKREDWPWAGYFFTFTLEPPHESTCDIIELRRLMMLNKQFYELTMKEIVNNLEVLYKEEQNNFQEIYCVIPFSFPTMNNRDACCCEAFHRHENGYEYVSINSKNRGKKKTGMKRFESEVWERGTLLPNGALQIQRVVFPNAKNWLPDFVLEQFLEKYITRQDRIKLTIKHANFKCSALEVLSNMIKLWKKNF